MSDEQPCEKESQPARHISRPRLVQASLFARTEDPVLMALREADVATMTAEELAEQVRRWQRELGGEREAGTRILCRKTSDCKQLLGKSG